MTGQLAERVADTLRMLQEAAREAGMFVTGDGRVSEANAAALLGLEAETLAKKRGEGKAPASYKLACGGARVSYRMTDLAAWVEGHREDF